MWKKVILKWKIERTEKLIKKLEKKLVKYYSQLEEEL